MAVDYDEPTITTSWTSVLSQLRDNIDAVAKMQKGVAASNTPTNTVKYEGNVFSRYDGSTFNIEALAVAGGGTGATSAASARTNLGTDNADNITSGTLGVSRLPTVTVAKGGTGATSASGARTNLGLGTLAVLNSGTGSGDVRLNSDNEAKFIDSSVISSGLLGSSSTSVDFTSDLTGGTPDRGWFEIVINDGIYSGNRFFEYIRVGNDQERVIDIRYNDTSNVLYIFKMDYSSDTLTIPRIALDLDTLSITSTTNATILSIKKVGYSS